MSQSSDQNIRSSMIRAARSALNADPAETEDLEHALVSVLYHALQGAQACDLYVDEAERAGNERLASFFSECRDEQSERAAHAKALLLGGVGHDSDGDGDGGDADGGD